MADHNKRSYDDKRLGWFGGAGLVDAPRAPLSQASRVEKLRGWGKDEDVKLVPNIPECNTPRPPESRISAHVAL
jgi:hypothetical protein